MSPALSQTAQGNGLPIKFSDPNFKLVVMQSLIENKRLNLGDQQLLAEKILKRAVDYEAEGVQFMPQVYQYLIDYPLSESDLASVKEINLDGGNDIYAYPFFFWGGESNIFDVQSLKDIVLCPNLEYLSITSMLESGDLSYLANLKKLQTIELSPTPEFHKLEALLELPELKELVYFKGSVNSEGLKVIKQLKDSGVNIKALQAVWFDDA